MESRTHPAQDRARGELDARGDGAGRRLTEECRLLERLLSIDALGEARRLAVKLERWTGAARAMLAISQRADVWLLQAETWLRHRREGRDGLPRRERCARGQDSLPLP
ncbi:MAG: hypothetical protein GF330_04850, partial [Candidatus Eisenbacteria bacterium]|nr:hypothetical protein [Candidatus Eisenbacteria bacterium]